MKPTPFPQKPTVVLSWPGKQPSPQVAPAPLQRLESFEPERFCTTCQPAAAPPNALYHGDNLTVAASLLDRGWGGKVRLIYADPPYNSKLVWTRKVRLRQPRQRGQDPVVLRQPQYTDSWPEEGAYLQFLYERLPLLRSLLADNGSLWLHCDHRHAHHLRCLLDEIFGPENYLNTITWRSQIARGAKTHAFYFPHSAQTILVYARNRTAPTCWQPLRRQVVLNEAEASSLFLRDAGGFFRTSDPGSYSFESLKRLHAEGRLYAPYGGTPVVDESQRQVFASNGGNLGVKYYLADLGDGRYQVERALDNLWEDVPGLGTTPGEDLGYPTQKTELLLQRILAAGSREGDWILDPFCGSGTTPAVAQKLGRRWLACDANYGAVQTAARRLHSIQNEQLTRQSLPAGAQAGFELSTTTTPPPLSHNLPATRLTITQIDPPQSILEIRVQEVQTPALQDAGREGSWLAWVDSIAIDPAYDGQLLRAVVVDAPLNKRTAVAGRYQLPAPSLPTTVGVRIVDIAGGEQLVTCRVDPKPHL